MWSAEWKTWLKLLSLLVVLGPFASLHRSSQVPQSGVGSPLLQGIELSLANSNRNCNPMQFRAWLVAATGSASSADSDLLAPPTLQVLSNADSALAGVSQGGPPGTPLGPRVQASGSVPAPAVGASLGNPEALFGCNNITVQVRKDNSPAEVYVVVVNSTDHVVLETVYDVQAPVMTKSVM